MKQPLNVLLGANGDLCAMLPFLRRESLACGEPVPLLVAKAYAPLLEGVSYVTPVVFDGLWHDLSAALRFLREELPDLPVRVLQFYQSRHDATMRSFLDEMWYQAGAWRGFEEEALVFDRRDETRERELVERVFGKSQITNHKAQDDHDGRPVILVGLEGRSSPMKGEDRRAVMRAIRREFGERCQIINLSKVKAVRAFDLLGLYERAAAVVSVDTMHLHLSKACQVPVFAISRDYPTLWHGTPWRPHFAWHGRYADAVRRLPEMIGALRAAVDGRGQGPVLEVVPGLPRFAYNPSLIEGEYGRVIARTHDRNDWRTRLYVDQQRVRVRGDLADCSQEDARVFWHQWKRMVSLTLARRNRRFQARCVQAFGVLAHLADGGWSVRDLKIPKLGDNNWRGMEKNWVFFSHSGAVHAIYACHPRHVVVRLDEDGQVVERWSTPGPRWDWGKIRGGTSPVPFGFERKDSKGRVIAVRWDYCLRFFHSRTEAVRKRGHHTLERYHMGALLMESAPPFRVVAVSRAPILSGDERPVPEGQCAHWKANVVIPYGCVPVDLGPGVRNQEWMVSLGVNDALSCKARVEMRDLNLKAIA